MPDRLRDSGDAAVVAVVAAMFATSATAGGGRRRGAAAWRTDASTLKQPDPVGSRVACPPSAECVTASDGETVAVSSDPTGGAATFTAGPRQIDARTEGQDLRDLACPAASRCLGADGADAIAEDPLTASRSSTELEPVGSSAQLHAVSCPSVSERVAVDDRGRLLVGRTP